MISNGGASFIRRPSKNQFGSLIERLVRLKDASLEEKIKGARFPSHAYVTPRSQHVVKSLRHVEQIKQDLAKENQLINRINSPGLSGRVVLNPQSKSTTSQTNQTRTADGPSVSHQLPPNELNSITSLMPDQPCNKSTTKHSTSSDSNSYMTKQSTDISSHQYLVYKTKKSFLDDFLPVLAASTLVQKAISSNQNLITSWLVASNLNSSVPGIVLPSLMIDAANEKRSTNIGSIADMSNPLFMTKRDVNCGLEEAKKVILETKRDWMSIKNQHRPVYLAKSISNLCISSHGFHGVRACFNGTDLFRQSIESRKERFTTRNAGISARPKRRSIENGLAIDPIAVDSHDSIVATFKHGKNVLTVKPKASAWSSNSNLLGFDSCTKHDINPADLVAEQHWSSLSSTIKKVYSECAAISGILPSWLMSRLYGAYVYDHIDGIENQSDTSNKNPHQFETKEFSINPQEPGTCLLSDLNVLALYAPWRGANLDQAMINLLTPTFTLAEIILAEWLLEPPSVHNWFRTHDTSATIKLISASDLMPPGPNTELGKLNLPPIGPPKLTFGQLGRDLKDKDSHNHISSERSQNAQLGIYWDIQEAKNVNMFLSDEGDVTSKNQEKDRTKEKEKERKPRRLLSYHNASFSSPLNESGFLSYAFEHGPRVMHMVGGAMTGPQYETSNENYKNVYETAVCKSAAVAHQFHLRAPGPFPKEKVGLEKLNRAAIMYLLRAWRYLPPDIKLDYEMKRPHLSIQWALGILAWEAMQLGRKTDLRILEPSYEADNDTSLNSKEGEITLGHSTKTIPSLKSISESQKQTFSLQHVSNLLISRSRSDAKFKVKCQEIQFGIDQVSGLLPDGHGNQGSPKSLISTCFHLANTHSWLFSELFLAESEPALTNDTSMIKSRQGQNLSSSTDEPKPEQRDQTSMRKSRVSKETQLSVAQEIKRFMEQKSLQDLAVDAKNEIWSIQHEIRSILMDATLSKSSMKPIFTATAYHMYVKSQMTSLTCNDMVEVLKFVTKCWPNLTPEERLPYKVMADYVNKELLATEPADIPRKVKKSRTTERNLFLAKVFHDFKVQGIEMPHREKYLRAHELYRESKREQKAATAVATAGAGG